MILRACSGALATALAQGNVPYQADLFTVTLLSGTIYRWTNWERDLVVAGNTFTSSGQWLSRGRWNVTYKMEVPSIEISILTTPAAFGGGLGLLTQLHNGLFDGATLRLQRVYMPGAGDTTTYGTVDLFAGDCGPVQLLGAKATIKVRGANGRMTAQAPRNLFQPGCIHTFCDAGCTLNPATFTYAFTVAGGSTRTQVVLTSNALAVPQLLGATVKMTSGVSNGQQRTIIDTAGGATSVQLSYPLIAAPVAGNTLTILSACDKRLPTCTTIYSNTTNFRGFPYVPPPASTAPGQ